MSTEYDFIAAAYLQSKVNPIKKYSEEYTFFEVLGDVQDKSVLDLACGDGFYTRMIRQAGAKPVLGVDISAEMIRLAKKAEEENPLQIGYQVADVARLGQIGVYDLVTAVYLLQYAPDEASLYQMMDTAFVNLRPQGRFVTVTGNPDVTLEHLQAQALYGAFVTPGGELGDGTPLHNRIRTGQSEVSFNNYHWTKATLERLLFQVGFQTCTWHSMNVSERGRALYPEVFWQTFLTYPGIALLECQR